MSDEEIGIQNTALEIFHFELRTQKFRVEETPDLRLSVCDGTTKYKKVVSTEYEKGIDSIRIEMILSEMPFR